MKKKLCAILLALCLPLTLLTGCGGNGAADGFLDTLKAAKNQKNYQLEVTSAEDESWEAGKKLTGTISKSNSQADLTLTAFGKGNKTLGTVKILVDGKDIYLKLDDWITYLKQQYQDMSTDSEEYASDIESLNQIEEKLDNKYVKISLSEDTFTLWEKSEGASGAFSKWYNGLGKTLKSSVTEQEGLYTLSLDAKGLEEVKIDWLTQLTENQEAYCDLLTLLLGSVEDTLAMAGWSSKDYLENIWSEYQENLTTLKENGMDKDAALEMTAVKEKDGVYQLSAVQQGENQRYLKATVTPLKQAPEKWTAPKEWKPENKLAEQLADLYLNNQIVSTANNTTQTEEEIPAEFDWDKRYEEEGDDTRDYGTTLNLSDLKGYTHLKSMKMTTEDDKKITLPMIPGAEYTEADKGEDEIPYSVYQSSTGWEGSVYDIELADRTPEEILQESVDTYCTTYQDEWGYRITQKASKVQSNDKGTACIAGFGYYDEERKCQVTWLSVVTQVKGSQYAVAYEYSLYADNVGADVTGAIQELCQYFQLTLPLVIQTK